MLDNFYVKLLAVGVVVYGLYWLMSPYQNCMRAGSAQAYCWQHTDW
jgi:hypothetical protein